MKGLVGKGTIDKLYIYKTQSMSRTKFTKGTEVYRKEEDKCSRQREQHVQRPNSESRDGFRDMSLEGLCTWVLMICDYHLEMLNNFIFEFVFQEKSDQSIEHVH